MNVPSERLQFFALEASDYLERLAALSGRSTGPAGDELVRLARALRGSALMAGLPAFSQAASGLEQVAKAYREGQWAWTPGHGARIAGAVEELKRLLGHAEEWTDEDTAAAARLGRDLVRGLAEPMPAVAPAGEQGPAGLPLSVRDFIAREGALIAGSLEHAAQAIELGALDQSADLVLRRLQPLRGLAALPALVPLPEFLDAVELTLRAYRSQAAPASGGAALRRVAGAVSRLARDIAARGEADANAPDFVGAAAVLLDTFGSEADVVPIESLFRSGDAAAVVHRGDTPAFTESPDSAIELVGLGDRLRQTADQLASTPSETGRLLLLYGMVVDLRPVARRAALERPYLDGLLTAITAAITGGRAAADPARFGDHLREAADTLARAAASRDATFFGDELEPAIWGLDTLAAGRAASPPVPIEALAPDAPVDLTAFEQSLSTMYRLERTAPVDAGDADDADDADDAVPIETLLYSGRRALERADAVRLELSAALRSGRAFDDVEPLVSELIDLVPLALAE